MFVARTSALLLGVSLAGCSSLVPLPPMGRFLAGDIETTRAFYDEQLRNGDSGSGALFLNGLAEMELLAGELGASRRHFVQAGQVMGNWATSGGETFGAIVGSESSKTWKGDPHEKVMNAFYAGLLYWLDGQLDNARACARQGLLADAESDEGGAQTDSALLYWLSGRMSLAMGRAEEAREVFDEARAARAFSVRHGAAGGTSNPVLEDPGHGNLVCVFSIGLGPTKYRTGPYGSVAATRPNPGRVFGAEVILDGVSYGASSILLDLDYQARTRGGRTIEGIRKGKAVFKDLSTVSGSVILNRGLNGRNSNRGESIALGIGLLVLGAITNPAADVRHWATLPQTVQVLTIDAEPGEHDLEVRFLDATGRPIRSYTQNWLVEVPPDGVGVYHFRDLPGLDSMPALDTRIDSDPQQRQA